MQLSLKYWLVVVHVLPGATLCLSHATACSNIVEGQKIIFLAQVMATFSGFHLDLFLSLYESDCAFSTDFKKTSVIKIVCICFVQQWIQLVLNYLLTCSLLINTYCSWFFTNIPSLCCSSNRVITFFMYILWHWLVISVNCMCIRRMCFRREFGL